MTITTGILSGTSTARTTDNSSAVKYVDPEERSTLDRNDFMKLFVTQLQYQDPMAPMESAEMASQVAQFNMVELMSENNEAMEGLVSAYQAQARLGSLSLLGREVQYEGGGLVVGEEGPKPFFIDMDTPTVSTTVTIRDATGALVRTLDLGPLSGDRQSIGWDGLDESGSAVAPGKYSVKVEGKDAAGESVGVTTWTTGTVGGIAYSDGDEPLLSIVDGPEISIYDVWKVNEA